MNIFWLLSTALLTTTLFGQEPPRERWQSLLPAGARSIETAELGATVGKERALVLWMLRPTKELRLQDSPYCGDWVYGDHWFGPARLSLVDTKKGALVNTVKVVGGSLASGDKPDTFRLPFKVADFFYHVARPDREHEGKPTIIDLHDLTGSGAGADFVLFDYEACGIADSTVFGYSPERDRAVQYRVEVRERGHAHIQKWVEQVFAHKPSSPGHWDFSWEPGHGANELFHERVSFDRKRQMFIDRHTVREQQDSSFLPRD